MYESFYGLDRKPFNLTPDPAFLYLSKKHQEAFAHLVYGIKNRSGFVMVSGEIGTGKTTISRTLLNQLDDDTEVAFIFNPYLSPLELLQKINSEFGIATSADSVRGLIDELNAYLLEKAGESKNCVLVIDEAQNLEPQVLEQVRLLSNLETETQKLLQIILIGQPELAEKLELKELRQLNQRITARYHLHPLDFEETLQYIAFRLRVAGGRKKVKFTHGAVKQVYKISQGTPRVINALCDRALLIGYTQEKREITPAIVKRAAREIVGEGAKRKSARAPLFRLRPAMLGAAVIAAVILVALQDPGGWISEGFDWVQQQREGFADRVVRIDDQAVSTTPGSARSMPIAEASASLPPVSEPPLDETIPPTASPAPETIAFAAYESGLDLASAQNHALAAILDAWSLAALSAFPADGSDASLVKFAVTNGMTYERLRPTPEQLYAINLPVLTLVGTESGVVWVALLGVAGDAVTLSGGEAASTEIVTREEFESHYTGNAAVLWIDPQPDSPLLRSSASGDPVAELQRMLRELGLYEPAPSGVYDSKTSAIIRRIQAETGLDVDGVAGRQTRMVLRSWMGHGPSLADEPLPSAVRARVQSASRTAAPKRDVASLPDAETIFEGGFAATVETGGPALEAPQVDVQELAAAPSDEPAEGGPVITTPPEYTRGETTEPAAGFVPLAPRHDAGQ